MDSSKKRQIGERLALIRASKRLSQKAMGDSLPIPWRTYQNYEMGTREAPVEFVLDFCDRFQIRPEWLINGKGGQHQSNDLNDLKSIILRVDNEATATGPQLALADTADIAIRLFRKMVDGQTISDQDYTDYIDLKRETPHEP